MKSPFSTATRGPGAGNGAGNVPGATGSSAGPARLAVPGAVLGAGLAATLVLARWRPLPADDPLSGTLVLLPALAAAFHALERWSADRGGRSPSARTIPARISAVHLAVLAGLSLLALARPHLGLPERSATLLFAGLVLLLGHRVALQLLALRPLLGRRLQRVPAPFFLLPLLVYLALLPWSGAHHPPDGDEPYYLLMTHSLAYDGDVDLTDNYARQDWRHFTDRPIEPQPGDPVGPEGELYSRHNMLVPLVLAPAYRVAGKAGAMAMMAAMAAALAWVTLHLGRHYVPERPGPALLAWAAVAFASPLVLYSYQMWVEVPAALLALLALDQILALERLRLAGWGTRQWLGIGLPVLLLPLVKLRFMLLAVPLLVLAWWYSGRPKKALILLGILLVVLGGGLLLHNQLLYDNPLKIHTWQELELYQYTLGDYLEGAVGIFWDSAFGLFAATPLWLLLLPAAIVLFRPGGSDGERRGARRARRLPVHLGILTLPYLAVVLPRPEWYGGWSPPFRYAVVALPLLGLCLAPLLADRRRPGARALLAGLGAVTLALMLLWLAVPGWTYNFAHGRTYLLDHLSTLLDADVARLFPSTVRPRPATWLWVLATGTLIPGLWLGIRHRPARSSEGLASNSDGDTTGSATGHVARSALPGVAAVLALLALVPVAATRLPTRVVELEDPWVTRTGGGLYPDRWSIERTRYRGGWVLHKGEELVAPVVAGGTRARVRLHLRFIRNGEGPFPVEIRAGDRVIGRWEPGPEDDRVWREVEVGPAEWPAGAPLVIAPLRRPGPFHGVTCDRAVFEWR